MTKIEKQASSKSSSNKVVIVGGGPAGLFSAYLLLKKGYEVDLYEGTSGVGKKFLVAGHGGLNLTHSEEHSQFIKRYGDNEKAFDSLLQDFSPSDLREFCNELGVETFIGSSGRVFPTKMKAAEMILSWTKLLKSHRGFNIFTKYKLIDINQDKELTFLVDGSEKVQVSSETLIVSLGGGSWKKTGSDGSWIECFKKLGIEVLAFQSANSGFETEWSSNLLDKTDNDPVKNVRLHIDNENVKGEIMLTPYGVEGGAFYAISRFIREKINIYTKATILIDLKPDLELSIVKEKLNKPRGKNSLSNHLRKQLKITGTAFILLKELTSKDDFLDMNVLAERIKSLELTLNKTRPLDESISTAGGVSFNEVDNSLMLKKIPGLYVIGEMLDWEAPTGGYLLQGCFSTAFRAVKGITKFP